MHFLNKITTISPTRHLKCYKNINYLIFTDIKTPFEYRDVKIKSDENPIERYDILPELGDIC